MTDAQIQLAEERLAQGFEVSRVFDDDIHAERLSWSHFSLGNSGWHFKALTCGGSRVWSFTDFDHLKVVGECDLTLVFGGGRKEKDEVLELTFPNNYTRNYAAVFLPKVFAQP
jgi:hypothetical protein